MITESGDIGLYDGVRTRDQATARANMPLSLPRLALEKVRALHELQAVPAESIAQARRLSSIHGSPPCDDLFYLPQMTDVVGCKQAHHVLDRFLAALGMHSVPLPLLGLERFKQRKIGFP